MHHKLNLYTLLAHHYMTINTSKWEIRHQPPDTIPCLDIDLMCGLSVEGACPSDYGITYFEIRKLFRWAELSIAGPAHQFALLLHAFTQHSLTRCRFTLRFGPSQDREDLVAEGGVALVRHCVRAQPNGLGVGLHPAVVRCGCARAICHLLVHTVGLSIAEGNGNISTPRWKKKKSRALEMLNTQPCPPASTLMW